MLNIFINNQRSINFSDLPTYSNKNFKFEIEKAVKILKDKSLEIIVANATHPIVKIPTVIITIPGIKIPYMRDNPYLKLSNYYAEKNRYSKAANILKSFFKFYRSQKDRKDLLFIYGLQYEKLRKFKQALNIYKKIESITSNKDSKALSNIYAVAETVDARDHYTRSHSKKVSKYAVALAEALNMEPLEINRLGTCALLHDIGKIGISDEILGKKGKLTAEEWEKIKVHPELGASIASRVRHLSHCIPCILHHHERYDGNGYPKGLKGEEIPLEARILAIADAFTAMTSERPFSKPVSYEEAAEEIKRGAGTQFDPKLAEVFLSVIKNISVATTSENKV